MIKKVILPLAAAAMIMTSCNDKDAKIGNIALNNDRDSVSYTIGNSIGQSLAKDGLTQLNEDIMIKAMRQAIQGTESQIDRAKAGKLIRAYVTNIKKKAGEEAKAAGEKFLAENKAKDGVTTTESGLQYEVITEGNGAKPLATDKVKVAYKGTLIDGTEFDANSETSFPLNGVIKGWTEGVQLMSVGSKYRFVIPSELAYGDRQAGAKIKPNSTLVFEIELIDIIKEEAKNKKK
jgi:FKBP-type peptidyl-prolyl cis-trans isomerase